jgi:hypothetical protein
MASATKRCRIEEVFGADGVCPEEPCPFWEQGAAGFGGCAFEKVDLENNPQVAEWLLRVRSIIEMERNT